MVLEQARITDEGLAELRAQIGRYNRLSQYGVGVFNEFACRDAVRHFCQGVGDSNPLYWDEEYARGTRHGTIIAPPTFLYSVYWVSGRVGGLPGVHGFHAGNDWEWYQTIREGDRINVQEQFTDVQEKEGRFAGRIAIVYSVATYRNQRGEVVARGKGWQVRAERGGARERGKYKYEPYQYTREEQKAIEEAVLSEEIRGSNPRFWDDVQVGEELRPVVKGPLSHGDLYAFVAGCIGGISHGLQLREIMRHPSWGWQDPTTGAREAIIRVHDVQDAASSAGLPGAYDYGCQRCCWVGHLLTNWMGDDGFLKRLYVELRRFNYIGDTTWVRGRVTGKRQEGENHLVDIDVWAENQRKESTATGKATVVLPTRHPAPF
ncbi:MAG: MaoC family dehydratase N-terminal domain-containing protein [Chloroflexi bacterium]|nr:MaoC family dehydratase N-terminal domain-containing protein [Chloroflexota bacterium]